MGLDKHNYNSNTKKEGVVDATLIIGLRPIKGSHSFLASCKLNDLFLSNYESRFWGAGCDPTNNE